jgi:hypothetical protein
MTGSPGNVPGKFLVDGDVFRATIERQDRLDDAIQQQRDSGAAAAP